MLKKYHFSSKLLKYFMPIIELSVLKMFGIFFLTVYMMRNVIFSKDVMQIGEY